MAMLCLSISASAYDFEVDGLEYTIVSDTNQTVSLTKNKLSGKVVVPSIVENNDIAYSVVEIGNEAFSEYFRVSTLTQVNLPNSIISIGDNAFYYCSELEEINLPESLLKIGDSAFTGCSKLKEIKFPESLLDIGTSAFSGCSFPSITISKNLKTIGSNAFGFCENLRIVYYNAINSNFSSEVFSSSERANIEKVVIGNEVNRIPDTFISYLTNVTEIEIPNSVTEIGRQAFLATGIKTIILPPSVENLGVQPFGSAKLIIIFSENLKIDPIAVNHLSNATLVSFTSNNIIQSFSALSKAYILKASFNNGNGVGVSYMDNITSEYNKTYDGKGLPIPEWVDILQSAGVSVSSFTLESYKNARNYEGSFNMEFGYSDYSITIPITYNFCINKATLTGYVEKASRLYGEENPDFICNLTGFISGDEYSAIKRYIFETEADASSDCGDYPVFANIISENYIAKITSGTLTVTKAPLTVIANDAERQYGESNPIFSRSYSGFKLDDTETSAFSSLPRLTCEASKTNDVGEYAITISGGEPKNYDITNYIPGKLIIKKAPLILSVNDAERLYYTVNPDFDYTLAGLVNDDDKSCIFKGPEYTCSASLTSNCGEYDIVPSNAQAKNYDISYKPGILTITPSELILVAAETLREYGDPNPILRYESIGLKGDDQLMTSLIDEPTLTTTATEYSKVGEYPIFISGGSSKNYKLSYRQGTLSVTKAPLTVIANDAERQYGESNPTFSRSYSGFKLDDTESSAFSSLPMLSCAATRTSDVGEYPIVVSGGTSRNYEIVSYENGVLNITKAPLTLVATDKSRLYFEENPSFDFTLIGLRNSDTKSCLTLQPTFKCAAAKTSNAGEYEIEPLNATAQNYTIDYQKGTLSINKRNLTASVSNYTKVYGTENPQFDIDYIGFVNNEDKSVLTNAPNIVCLANKSSDVGSYPISLDGGNALNYDISNYNSGTLTIEKADQIITWNQDLSNIQMYSQVALEASSSAGLPVSYEMSPNNVASLYNNNGKWYLDCFGSGAVNIRAVQNGDKNHNAAPLVSNTLVVMGTGGDPSNPQIFLNVENAGTLPNLIADNRKYQIKNLRLTGYLNGTDINFLREMAGSDSYGNSTPGILETLDISGCTIVSGGRSYYKACQTSNNMVGDYMFYNCKQLVNLMLPDNTTVIEDYAFADCDRL